LRRERGLLSFVAYPIRQYLSCQTAVEDGKG
jgi:hypothetical protein